MILVPALISLGLGIIISLIIMLMGHLLLMIPPIGGWAIHVTSGGQERFMGQRQEKPTAAGEVVLREMDRKVRPALAAAV
ncbi:unnamed protein product [Linum trigynum]|uniref:Uncharacterized protein n=1 Tax=Linum trigynum TaxID=586398 RepID=A0AAV2DS97_9ROSI